MARVSDVFLHTGTDQSPRVPGRRAPAGVGRGSLVCCTTVRGGVACAGERDSTGPEQTPWPRACPVRALHPPATSARTGGAASCFTKCGAPPGGTGRESQENR